jgi:glycosyltransferase involved in cell wall biosynthesis
MLMEQTVTVLMPVRNGERYLRAACASVLAQRGPALEFLIIDDGSTDATPQILQDFVARDHRVRVLHQEASGIVVALNRGLRMARTSLIARMDADDLCLPGRLAAQVAHVLAHPRVVALGTGWQVIDTAGAKGQLVAPPASADAVRVALADRNCLAHPSVVLQRDAALQAGGYRQTLTGAEDYDLWLRLSGQHDVENLPQPLIGLRQHPDQVTKRRLEQRILAEIGANWLHKVRQRGTEPSFSGENAVSRSLIVSWGMPADELSAGIIARALGAAHDALANGDPDTARVAARLVMAEGPPLLRTRVHVQLLGVRARLLGRRGLP